ncbi:MAG: DUF2267 domain-containing protein [Rhizobiales bacterium]|jgi:hypothetical protein|nr:DUF2267 domain-containing protein [Hyphomicrobiales bacterium]MBN9010972.1 DUF2267 domain-containing protein [Hyphomicrobiales bacterium]
MEELVARLSAATGLDPVVARKAAAIILRFLVAEGPADKVGPLVDALPGAADVVKSQPPIAGGIMGAFNDLTAAGLGMGEIQGAARTFVDFARERAGAATVDRIVAGIPGLSQFI